MRPSGRGACGIIKRIDTRAARVVHFLAGSRIEAQILAVRDVVAIEILVPHPVPIGDHGTSGYAERFPREVRARLER